jgi:hypothetical protein
MQSHCYVSNGNVLSCDGPKADAFYAHRNLGGFVSVVSLDFIFLEAAPGIHHD